MHEDEGEGQGVDEVDAGGGDADGVANEGYDEGCGEDSRAGEGGEGGGDEVAEGEERGGEDGNNAHHKNCIFLLFSFL